MKKGLLLAFLALAPMASAHTLPRGSRCQDEVCFEAQRSAWRQAIANADGRHAHRVGKMLAAWTKAGFPEGDFISKKYAKIHAQFRKEVMNAGVVWFYEVQGYSNEQTTAIVDTKVNNAEVELNSAVITLWLDQSGD